MRTIATRLAAAAMAAGLAAGLAGCGLKELARQSELAETVQKISGQVQVETGRRGALHVVVFQQGEAAGDFAIVGDVIADPSGSFRISAAPGEYFIGAYQDTSGDGVLQRDIEPAAYYNDGGLAPRPFRLEGGRGLKIAEPLVLRGPLRGVPEVRSVDGAPAVVRNIGRVVSLDDPMFSAENAELGTWRPVDFLNTAGGGLFMLEPYDPRRTPIIFVHGVNGSPADLRALIEGLDRSRFQAWVLHYPSGLRLEVIGDYLDRATDVLQSRYGFERLFVVGYSMGGLVSRLFVLNHAERGHQGPIVFFMTINSPMMGMGSAAKGVEFSPVVVPSWRDVAAGSEFVRALHARHLPAAVDYRLVFSYQPGEDGDGVVPVASQIPLSLQDEADHVQGFEASHAGILRDPEFVRRFAATLAAAERRPAAR